MNYLNLNWNYGYEVSEECEMYEFEGDSLSQVCYVESLNETESLLKETFEMEIKQVACGEWVDEMSNKLNQ